jgi:hypothetical protein
MSGVGLHRRGLVVAGVLALGLALSSCRDAACPPPDLSAVPLLDESEKAALASYLATRPDLRVPLASECGCDDDIAQMRMDGEGGQPMPQYEPYILRGDFNGDGEEDFAIMLARETEDGAPGGVLAIFNGPFGGYGSSPSAAEFKFAFRKYLALFARQDDGHLLMGQFESEGCAYEPRGAGYDAECGDDN